MEFLRGQSSGVLNLNPMVRDIEVGSYFPFADVTQEGGDILVLCSGVRKWRDHKLLAQKYADVGCGSRHANSK